MKRILFSVVCFCFVMSVSSSAKEINYSNCKSIQDVILIESQEITSTPVSEHEELAQLYASRGESYLLDSQYEKAIEDFQTAYSHLEHTHDGELGMVVSFRAAFGEVVCYDNLGMSEQTQQALYHLQTIASHIGCYDCIAPRPCKGLLTHSFDHFKNMIFTCTYHTDQTGNHDNFDDILGPDQPPELNWCEEVVTGVGRSMEAIACLAPNFSIKVVLIGIIETLIQRGLKCCQAGGFWKACVAPISRKWKEWKNNKEYHFFPNEQNLPRYTN